MPYDDQYAYNVVNSLISLNNFIINNNLSAVQDEVTVIMTQNQYEGSLWENTVDFFYLYDNYKNESLIYVIKNLDVPNEKLQYIRYFYYCEEVFNWPIMIESKVQDMIENYETYMQTEFPLLSLAYYFALVQQLITLHHFDNLQELLWNTMMQQQQKEGE